VSHSDTAASTVDSPARSASVRSAPKRKSSTAARMPRPGVDRSERDIEAQPGRRQLRRKSVDAEVLRETGLVAREAPRAAEAITPDFLGIPRPINALIPDGREEFRLKRQREDVVNPALRRELLHGTNDAASKPLSLRATRYGNGRDLGHG